MKPRLPITLLLGLLLPGPLLLGGCTPWVKPYERANLADPIMSFERDPIAGGYLHHVYEAREAARGGDGSTGGGCGCN